MQGFLLFDGRTIGTMKARLLREFELESATTRRVLERVPGDRATPVELPCGGENEDLNPSTEWQAEHAHTLVVHSKLAPKRRVVNQEACRWNSLEFEEDRRRVGGGRSLNGGQY